MLKTKIAGLKERILNLAMIVDDMLKEACTAVYQRDHLIASNVILAMEQLVNRMETENETLCVEFLALFQPEAVDLRTVVSLLKINGTLERMADHAVNIAQRIPSFSSIQGFKTLKLMFARTSVMLRDCIDALANDNARKATRVISGDAVIDGYLRKLTDEISVFINKNPQLSSNGISALLIGRDLERMADLTTNICEDVVYVVDGEVLKHRNIDKKCVQVSATAGKN